MVVALVAVVVLDVYDHLECQGALALCCLHCTCLRIVLVVAVVVGGGVVVVVGDGAAVVVG